MLIIWNCLARLLSVFCILVPLTLAALEQGETAAEETATAAAFLTGVQNPDQTPMRASSFACPNAAEQITFNQPPMSETYEQI